MKILIYGLSGAGKTYIAEGLMKIFGDEAEWFNADAIRTKHNDWDFSKKGRERQKQRMMYLSSVAVSKFTSSPSEAIDKSCPVPISNITLSLMSNPPALVL